MGQNSRHAQHSYWDWGRTGQVVLVLFVLLVVSNWIDCGKSDDNQLADISAAPDFSLKTMDDVTVSLSDLQGKVVMLNFWATWCGPCRMEIPHLKNLYTTFERKDFEILALSDEGSAQIRPFVKKYELPYPVVYADRQTLLKYNIRAFPTTILVDKKGIIRHKWEGLRPEETFVRAIKQLIEG